MANEEEMALETEADGTIIAAEQVERRIYTVRGQNVLLDSDRAELPGVETRTLNQAVRRNMSRFPIMRAFVGLRGLLSQDSDLARRILTVEQKYDEQFAVVFKAIRQLIETPPAPEQRLGFHTPDEENHT